jgi:hypothetical protein
MLVRECTNISNGIVTILLASGNTIQLPPNGTLTNVDIINLSGIQNLLKIVYALND